MDTSSPTTGGGDAEQMTDASAVSSYAVVLHEDKRYYPSASEVFGPDVEVTVQDEDTQALSEPIVAPVSKVTHDLGPPGGVVPSTTYDAAYLAGLMDHSDFVRSVAVVGGLHAGKSSLLDVLVAATHPDLGLSLTSAVPTGVSPNPMRWTDVRKDEQAKKISIKASPVSLVLPGDANGKSYLVHALDTPGHPNFHDETVASLALADSAMIVIDAVEGAVLGTELAVQAAVRAGSSAVLVINKVDRLVTELRLPPGDAYHKLRQIIAEANSILDELAPPGTPDRPDRFSPPKGNVVFASAAHGWAFTLQTFAALYGSRRDAKAAPLDVEAFAARLWGDSFFNPASRTFVARAPNNRVRRAAVQFVLDPLYKLYGAVLGSEGDQLKTFLGRVGIHLKAAALNQDAVPLLRTVVGEFFGSPAQALASSLVRHGRPPGAGAAVKMFRTWTGPQDGPAVKAGSECDAAGPFVAHVTKLYPRSDGNGFDALARVMSGTLKKGDNVSVVSPSGGSGADSWDSVPASVSAIYVSQSRYRVEVSQVAAGNWALLEGVDASINKSATLVSVAGVSEDIGNGARFAPMNFGRATSTMKIALEPLNPAELPKMLEGLRSVSKSFPLLEVKAEDSGERYLLGTGEPYMDAVLMDLRERFSSIEIKVSDPSTIFCETVSDTSTLKASAQTPNGANSLTMIAEPLEESLVSDLDSGLLDLDSPPRVMRKALMDRHGWDILAARSLWAFGPDADGTNALLDDTLPTAVDKTRLSTVRESIVSGFNWATSQGPLCESPVRGVKFRLLEADLDAEERKRGAVTMIPTARRVTFSSMLLAAPRLMEPVYLVQVMGSEDAVRVAQNVVRRRRGYIVSEAPKSATPLVVMRAHVPVIDSFGLETDIRTATQGMAMVVGTFSHWDLAPGDPMDKSIVLRPLEPAAHDALAREFMIKTRRRKGLTEDVSVTKYFDEELLRELAEHDPELAKLL